VEPAACVGNLYWPDAAGCAGVQERIPGLRQLLIQLHVLRYRRVIDGLERPWITSPGCQNFFSKLKDPNASNYLAGWFNAVEQQNWFNGHLSTVTLFKAGAYETGIPADKLAQMKVFPVSCIELTPPTLLQIENGDARRSFYLVGLSQLQPPSNEAYYNGAALDYIIPSAIAHEAFHNVTQKNDVSVRTILGISPVASPDPNNPNYSTDDISLKLENEGCAPPR
jgi:hypothetical protein